MNPFLTNASEPHLRQCILLSPCFYEDSINQILVIEKVYVSLKGATVSIDAMGCQKSIAEKIVEKKADYLLAVKNNQPDLYKDIDILFSSVDSRTLPVENQEYQTIDKAHCRLETRTYSLLKDVQLLSAGERWPKL